MAYVFELTYEQLFLYGALTLAVLILLLITTVFFVRYRHYLLSLVNLFFDVSTYISLQLAFSVLRMYFENYPGDSFERAVFRSHAVYLWLNTAVALIAGLYFLYIIVKIRNTSITVDSVKQGIDNLNQGICVYYDGGTIIINNLKADQIYRSLYGRGLINGKHFKDLIDEKKNDQDIIMLEDNSYWLSGYSRIKSYGFNINRIVLTDVTEEYRLIKELMVRSEEQKKLNQVLNEYSRQIVDSITQREILNAKIRIHDNLGMFLISAKHYITSGGTKEEYENLLKNFSNTINTLKNAEISVNRLDEYTLMLDTAKEVNLSIHINGELPEREPYKHIVASALHETMTNTIRHANGNNVYIDIDETDNRLSVSFRNDGKAPEGKVEPRGGLLSIKELTEKIGGSFSIENNGEFILNLSFVKENEDNGI